VIRRPQALVLLLGIAVASAAAVGALTTTNARPAPGATALHVAAGLSFIGVGVVVWSREPANRTGLLTAAVGLAWFVTDVRYLPSSVAFTVADLVGAPLAYAVLAHLAVAFPSGRLRSRSERAVVVIAYGWLILENLAQDVFWAPADSRCDCVRNLIVVHRDAHLHGIVGNVQQAINVVLAFVVLRIVLDHWSKATPPGRRALAPVFWASGPILLAVIALQAVGAFGSLKGLDAALAYLTPLALMSLPFGFLAGFVHSRLSHLAVGHLVIELGGAPPRGRLRDTLARALGDPSLMVAYWMPDFRAYVDTDGRRVDLPTEQNQRAATFIERAGEPVAALLHDPSLKNDPWLIDAVAAAAGLALENERLHADISAQLKEVRASRARIVEASDAERRRLERDLHDGAQQRLVSLSLALRLAGDQLGNAPEPLVRETLNAAADQLRLAIAELRELASGIHPAILTEAGLGPALQSVAERAPLPVALTVPTDRLPRPVEAAAYFVVCEAVANICKHADAHSATVSARRLDGRLLVEVADDGVGGADPSHGSGLRGLADRVAALNGRIDVVSPPGQGTRIVVTIPCG